MRNAIFGSLAVLGLMVSMGAKAQTVEYKGTTAPTFVTSNTSFSVMNSGGNSTLKYEGPPNPPAAGTALATLSPGTFDVFTTSYTSPGNSVAIGGDPTENLGVLQVLTTAPLVNLTGESIAVHLPVTFNLPPNIGGGGPFNGTVTGFVSITNAGGVNLVSFKPTQQLFTFHPPTGSSFTLSVSDLLNITSGHTGYISGTIVTNAPSTPEPASLALLLPGLTPLGFLLRRRSRS